MKEYWYLEVEGYGEEKLPQLVYGKTKAEEYTGELKNLLLEYHERQGRWKEQFAYFIPLIAKGYMWDNRDFKTLLIDCGKNCHIMQELQEDFYKEKYGN